MHISTTKSCIFSAYKELIVGWMPFFILRFALSWKTLLLEHISTRDPNKNSRGLRKWSTLECLTVYRYVRLPWRNLRKLKDKSKLTFIQNLLFKKIFVSLVLWTVFVLPSPIDSLKSLCTLSPDCSFEKLGLPVLWLVSGERAPNCAILNFFEGTFTNHIFQYFQLSEKGVLYIKQLVLTATLLY